MKETKEMYPSWGDDHGVRLGNVKISDLHDFKEHPFHVVEDTALFELAKSIEDKGVLVPLIVRANPYGDGYEIIAGHRRKAACKWAGLSEVPVMIVELDDNEAVIAMVDSNLQREHIKPSEKAFAYKMKLEAMKQQGKRTDLTSCQVDKKSVENPTLFLAKVGCGYDENGRLPVISALPILLVMLMAVCLTVSLVACGNSDSGDKKESSSETVVENENSEEKESTEDTVSDAEQKTDVQEPDKTEEDKADGQETGNQELTVDPEYANLQESIGFIFESNGDGTCTLTKIGDCTDSDIVIPEKSPAGDTVTMIAEYAFYGAEDINSIVIAGKTMELDTKAFQSCEAKKIVITGCDMVIGENAFSYCEDITEIYISGSNIKVETYAFYDTGKDMSVNIENCTGILDQKAFQACGIAGLTINNSTLELDENVFSYCEDLTTVTFDNSTVEIGTYAFYDSGDDATVTFTNCGLDIDDKAFQSCGLTTINISGSETVMGDNAFSYCEDLTDIIIGAGNTEIGTYSFYDCPTELVINYNGGSYNKESIEDAK